MHGSGFKKQGMQNSHGLHLKDKVLQVLRRKRPLQNRFPGGWKAPRGTENNSPECCQLASATRAVIWGWGAGSQGDHLKGGQRPSGRGHVLLLSEQPQKDVLFILGPAVDVSVLQPGGHMLLGQGENDKQKSSEKNLDSRPRAQFPNTRGFPFAGISC